MRRTAYAILTAHWLITAWWYLQLPERLPVHFNLRGQPDRWTDDPALIWFLLPVVSTLLLLMFVSIGRWSRSQPQLWNIPDKKRFLALTAEQREPIITRLLGVMDVAGLYTCVLLFYVQVAMYQSAISGEARLGWDFHVLIWGGLILLLVHTFRVNREIRQAILRASQESMIDRSS